MENLRKPEWLKSNKLGSRRAQSIAKYMRIHGLHTVCENAKCPNQGECFERGTATFMILGNICTRNCGFCAVRNDIENLQNPQTKETESIALLCNELKLKHVVITSVTRDDLDDGGAGQFAKTIREIRKHCDETISIEVLIPDLQGNWQNLSVILNEKPDVLNHNIETIERLYFMVRPQADYHRSLALLTNAKNRGMITKSGLMVGLGEKKEEVLALMDDLRAAEVDILTIGQYMQPSKNHIPVVTFVHPDTFEYYKEKAMEKGFTMVESAPLVRSSYHAEKARDILKKRR